MVFGKLHLVVLRVVLHLFDDAVNFFLLQVDDVVHEALSQLHVTFEEFKVECSLGRKGVLYVGIEVDGQQAAAVVGTEGNFAAGIGRHGFEAQVSVAVGYAFALNSVPKEYAGFGTAPGIVYNFFP